MDDPNPSAAQSHQHTVRSVSLGTLWRMLRYPFVLLSAVVIPPLMGDTAYGRYAFFMSVYLILDVFTDVGVTQVFGRFLPGMADGSGRLLHTMLFYGLWLTLGVALVGGGALLLSGRVAFAPVWWLILGLLLVLTKIEGTLFAFIYGRNEIARYSMKELVRSAATFALVVLLFWRGGLTGALWALVLNECILLALGLYWTRAALFQPFARMPLSEFKPYFVFGVAFYVPAFLFSLLQRSGNVFIQALTGAPESVAHYDVANQFLVLTATFLGVIFMTLLPALSNLHARAEHATIARWNRVVMTYCGAVVFLAFHTLVLAGRPLIQVWLGSDFAPVYPTALILCAALPPALMVYAGMNFALLEKRPGPFAAGVCGGWVAMAAAGLLLIPRHGAIGAAWATVLGFAIPAATLAARYRDLFMPMLAGFGKAWLPGLIIMTVYWAEIARSWPIPVCLGSALFYILLLFSFRIISVSDFKKVMAAFGRKTT